MEGVGGEGVARAFVAVPCPPRLREALAAAAAGWREVDADVRWTDASRAHLTLRFLGRSSGPALEVLDDRLGALARACPPLALRPGEPGAFPGWRRPRVLWLGLEEGGALGPLAEGVEEAAREAGFPPETRPFRPHLTLGRVRSPRGADRAVAAVREWRPSTPAEAAAEVVLYRSDTAGGGPRYTALATYALTGRRT